MGVHEVGFLLSACSESVYIQGSLGFWVSVHI